MSVLKKGLLFTLICLPLLLWSQEIKEEKNAFFSFSAGDDEVELFLDGSWEFSLNYIHTDDFSLEALAGIEFSQKPDITSSLWLMNRFFFEISYSDTPQNDSFLLGYQGRDNELLQEVRIGNTDMNIGTYAGITVPAMPFNSAGIRVQLQTEKTLHEAVLRYSKTREVRQNYRGNRLITEHTLSVGDFARGHFFILPDTETDFLTIVQETDKGYSLLEEQDYRFDNSRGLLYIKDNSYLSLLIYYEKEGVPLGNDLLGKEYFIPLKDPWSPDLTGSVQSDFNFSTYPEYKESYDGRDFLILKERGVYSPFEQMGSYILPFPGNREGKITLLPWYEDLSFIINDNFITLYNDSLPGKNILNRYPLAEHYSEIYSQARVTRPGTLTYTLTESKGEYAISTNAVPGSVSLFINSYEESDFTVDYTGGTVTINRVITPADSVEIVYREGSETGNGNLFASYGGRFHLTDSLFLELFEYINWSLTEKDTTYPGESNPGILSTNAQLTYTLDNYQGRLLTQLNGENPDVNGKLRLLSEGDREISLLFTVETTGEPELKSAGYTPLIKRDYTKEERGDSVFYYPYSSSPAISGEGPSLAASDNSSLSRDTVLVMEYDIRGTDTWSAARHSVNTEIKDFSNTDFIRFNLLSSEAEAGAQLKISLGDLNNTSLQLEKNITLTGNSWETITLPLSREEKQKLTHVNFIDFSIHRVPAGDPVSGIFYINGLTFNGNTLSVIEDSASASLMQRPGGPAVITAENPGNILLGKALSPVTPGRYEILRLEITDNTLLTEDSIVEIRFVKNSTELFQGEFILPLLSDYSSLELEWNTVTGELKLNGSSVTTSGFNRSELTGADTLYLSFRNTGSGKMTLSKMELTDPLIQLQNRNSLYNHWNIPMNISPGGFPLLGTTEIKTETHHTWPQNSVMNTLSLHSEILGTTLKAKGSVLNKGESYRASHSVTLPSFSSPLTYKDYFSLNETITSHRGELTFQTQPLILTLTSEMSSRESENEHSLRGDLLLQDGALFSSRLFMEAGRTRTEPRSAGTYFHQWYTLISDIIPRKESGELRHSTLLWDTKLSLGPLTIQFKPETSWLSDISPMESFGILFASELLLPLNLKTDNKGSWIFTPSLNNAWSRLDEEPFKESYTAGNALWAERVETYFPWFIFNPLPLFNREENQEYFQMTEGAYETASSTKLQFKAENNRSLFPILLNIPGEISASVEKHHNRILNDITVSSETNIQMSLWFSDNFSTSFSYNKSRGIIGTGDESNINWDLKCSINMPKNSLLKGENSLTWEREGNSFINQAGISYEWKSDGGSLFIIPYTKRIIDEPYHYSHREEVLTDIKINNEFTVTGAHTTALNIHQTGEASFTVKSGYRRGGTSSFILEIDVVCTLLF